ncbi:hypothetical protein BH23ACT5_BH23ACT5_01130 [soil metagenome]
MAPSERLDTLVGRLEGAGAIVLRCTPDTLSHTIIGLIGEKGWKRVVSVRRNRVGHPSVLGDDPQLADEELKTVDAVITESLLAVAATGTIVLDHGPGQGRRALTLIPDTHVCVVQASAAVDDVAQAVVALGPERPATWISGPSAVTDVDPRGVDEVGGPRSLFVVLVEDLRT